MEINFLNNFQLRGLKHLLSEGCGEPGSEDIKSNMFSEILTINKYLILVLAWQSLCCDNRLYFKTLIYISYLMYNSQTGVCVREYITMIVVILRDKAPSRKFPGKCCFVSVRC